MYIQLPVGSLFLFRVVLVSGIVFLLWKKKISLDFSYYTKNMSYILLFWLGFGLLGLIWTPDLKAGLMEIANLTKGVAIFMLISSLLKQFDRPVKLLRFSWLISLGLVLFIAWYEFYYNKHLQSHFSDLLMTLDHYNVSHKNLISVFSGPNELSVFLSLSIPFLLLSFKKQQFIAVVLILISVYLIWLNDSKIVVISSVFQLLSLLLVYRSVLSERLYAFFTNKVNVAVTGVVVVLFVGLLGTGTFYSYPTKTGTDVGMMDSFSDDFNAVMNKQNQGKWTDGHFSRTLSSRDIRKALIQNGLVFWKDSYFFGAGAGSFMHKMSHYECWYDADNFVNPHSWWIEILSQYGVIVFLLYFGWMGAIFIMLVRKLTTVKNSTDYYKEILAFCFTFFLAYLLCTNSSSSFMALPINWVGLAIVAFFADRMKGIIPETQNEG